MGVQRHIKVLGIFARLFHRDGKSRYLQDMPLVMSYLRKACERYRAARAAAAAARPVAGQTIRRPSLLGQDADACTP